MKKMDDFFASLMSVFAYALMFVILLVYALPGLTAGRYVGMSLILSFFAWILTGIKGNLKKGD